MFVGYSSIEVKSIKHLFAKNENIFSQDVGDAVSTPPQSSQRALNKP